MISPQKAMDSESERIFLKKNADFCSLKEKKNLLFDVKVLTVVNVKVNKGMCRTINYL